jgi:uncharacterized membrane protein
VKVLLVGETWTSYGVHLKGMTVYTTSSYEESLAPLRTALTEAGVELVHVPNHEVPGRFPRTLEELDAYDVVVLSDVSADTILLHPDTMFRSQRTPNAFLTLNDWVERGGALAMIGGYMSFSGFEGKARYYMTALPDVLPVSLVTHDDRVERPEGVHPTVTSPDHPVLAGIPTEWPHFLGYNLLLPRPEAEVLLDVDGDPLLAVREVGKGRTAAFASDLSPHWAPSEFLDWPHYGPFWTQLLGWLAGDV